MKIILLIIFGILMLSVSAPFIFVFEVIFLRAFMFLFIIAIIFIALYFVFGGFSSEEKKSDEMDVILEEFYKYKKNSVAFGRVESFLRKCSKEFKSNNKRLSTVKKILSSFSSQNMSSLEKLDLTIEESSLIKRNELIISKATSVLKIVMNEDESVNLEELDAILSKVFKN